MSQKSADALRLSIGMSGLCGAIGSGRPPEARRVDGTSSSLMLEYGLLVLVALAMAVSIQVVGIILVVAMLVTPAATAQLLTDRFGRMLLAAVGFSVVESVVGLYLSFYGNWASAATIVLVETAVFGLALALSPRRGVLVGRPVG